MGKAPIPAVFRDILQERHGHSPAAASDIEDAVIRFEAADRGEMAEPLVAQRLVVASAHAVDQFPRRQQRITGSEEDLDRLEDRRCGATELAWEDADHNGFAGSTL